MVQFIKKTAVGFLLLFYGVLSSQNIDPIFAGLKTYYITKTNCTINKDLFAKRAKNDGVPFNYVYVSKLNRVQNVLGNEPYIYSDDDSTDANDLCDKFSEMGLSTFHYKTLSSADANITTRLLNYSAESKAFLVFHELTYAYILENDIPVSHPICEAACDVVGVMYSKQLLKEKHVLNKEKFNTEIKALETVYTIINSTIKKIENDSASCSKYCNEAEQKISNAVKNCDDFFKDRFLYPVNTAYLLKNSNNSTHYFVVKEIFQDSKSFKKFIHTLTLYIKM